MANTRRDHKNVRFKAVFFDSADDLKACAAEARLRNIEVYDVFSPFPIHGIDTAVGLEPSRLTWIGFVAGLLGLSFALTLQVWTSAYDWALNVGGTPFNSFPLFIPVAFELTVLFAGLISIGVLFLRNRLWIFSKKKIFDRVTDDRFVLVLQQTDASLDPKIPHRLFEKYNAVGITEGDEFV